MHNNFQGGNHIEPLELPKRKKTKGIRGRSTQETISQRHAIIREILSDKVEMSKTLFVAEFKKQCRMKNIQIPSQETIRTDLKHLGYYLKKGKIVYSDTTIDYVSAELIQRIFNKTKIKRIYLQVKSDEYLLYPMIQSEDTVEVNSFEYFQDIREKLEIGYHSENSVSIYFSFASTGYESGIAQLFMDTLPEHILSCSTSLHGLIIISTISNLNEVLDFLYAALPENLETLVLENTEQPLAMPKVH